MPFAPVEDLIAAIRAGEMVILVDDENRENEGDFVMAAEKVSAEAISYMAIKGRGLVCAPVSESIADRLLLAPMVEEHQPQDAIGCAFTISVDAREGVSTGISAYDRAKTIELLVNPATRAQDLRRPGHIFPLRAKNGGVLKRPGHTEAAIDLARLAGFREAGVICEIMNDDGTMSRLDDLRKFAEQEGMLLGCIEDLIAWRKQHDAIVDYAADLSEVRWVSAAELPTPLGVFQMHVFLNEHEEELICLSMGDLKSLSNSSKPEQEESNAPTGVLTRVHSACFTGDVLGSLRCDCGGQLQMAMRSIGEAGQGLLIYLPQEGRGIGLAKKIEAYSLQEQGLDTVEANHKLGFAADLRSYEDAAGVLRHFGIQQVRLLTNNPAKIDGLTKLGIQVTERLKIEPGPGPVNHRYLQVKKGKLGHFFEAI